MHNRKNTILVHGAQSIVCLMLFSSGVAFAASYSTTSSAFVEVLDGSENLPARSLGTMEMAMPLELEATAPTFCGIGATSLQTVVDYAYDYDPGYYTTARAPIAGITGKTIWQVVPTSCPGLEPVSCGESKSLQKGKVLWKTVGGESDSSIREFELPINRQRVLRRLPAGCCPLLVIRSQATSLEPAWGLSTVCATAGRMASDE